MSNAQLVRNSIDHRAPPAGVRIELGSIAGALGVSVAEMAGVTGLARAEVFSILAENVWPKGVDAAAVRAALRELISARGATEAQLSILFEARVSSRRHPTNSDYHCNQPGYVPRRLHEPRTGPAARRPSQEELDMLLPKQTLSSAARKHFKLPFVNPFDGSVESEDDMFVNDEIAYVREACWQAALGGRFIAITSESGAGKTTIVEDLEARIQRERRQVVVIRPSVLGMEETKAKGSQIKAGDILASIISTLDAMSSVPPTIEGRARRVNRLLTAGIEAGFHHLLVIEEAHCLPDSTLKHLKRLHEMRLGRRSMLGILLVAQPELCVKLDPRRATLREVTQRCEIIRLHPLDADLARYVEHRARLAGRQIGEFMESGAIEEIRSRLTVVRSSSTGKSHTTLTPPRPRKRRLARS